ncbi:uncharacterized protein BO80DRAFT_362678, partial [Aspergillus ibericus CBS 121593]
LLKNLEKRFRFYIDYYILNIIFIKDYYPLPLIKKSLNYLKEIYYFTKINIISIFNNI